MLAAVMTLTSELVTPPVTKTYFGIGLPRTSWWLERAAEDSEGRARAASPLATREAIIPHRRTGVRLVARIAMLPGRRFLERLLPAPATSNPVG